MRRKRVFQLVNSYDEAQIRISTVNKNKKSEPLISVACAGCGRTQRLRERRVVLCDGYTCGFGGHCAKNPRFVLSPVPEGCVRHIVPNAAGAFSGYNTRFATPEQLEAIVRATDVLIRGRAHSHLGLPITLQNAKDPFAFLWIQVRVDDRQVCAHYLVLS